MAGLDRRNGRVRVSAARIRPLGWLLVTLAVVAGYFTLPSPASACTITSPYPNLRDQADGIAIAFAGRQIRYILDDPRTTLVFEVDRVYKGHIGPVVEVQTLTGNSCGTNFRHRGTTAVVALLAERDSRWTGLQAGDVYVTYVETFYSIADLEEVFGAGYPPDPTIQLPEPAGQSEQVATTHSTTPTTVTAGNPTRTRQLVATGIASVVFGASLIAIHRRIRQE
ncbi:MAG: hypothetical protein F4Z17_09445 [Acidimicrobiia bacterium]|nr:hypothetical protein [Acidimicrobiia bacterium]